ncbi:hypothetical protein EVAR_61290_1 [Eumeta japonica]|uniref:Uncharacterized protein n=1 Tax=Eumeta variegata TaxID=151549 RepID=A0A4C1XKB2_EUMVA|nr:hypothetical protein EVAR_61290_1 [Eumeta japonica]
MRRMGKKLKEEKVVEYQILRFVSIDVNFNSDFVFDSDPLTLDSDSVSTLVFDPISVLNFDSDLAFNSDPGPVPDSALHPAINSDSTINYSSNFNEVGML